MNYNNFRKSEKDNHEGFEEIKQLLKENNFNFSDKEILELINIYEDAIWGLIFLQ